MTVKTNTHNLKTYYPFKHDGWLLIFIKTIFHYMRIAGTIIRNIKFITATNGFIIDKPRPSDFTK